jgi:UDP-N-acetylglucosamine--N-acetylmuramyl-(pentapeptide) pyrophosphoryl-undecaprenol N-acetylglucosamine transferase
MNYKIIIAGGGTGGHIFPAIAIANELKRRDDSIQILFVGAKGKMEMEKVPQAGFEIRGIDIAGFNRSSILKNISLPFKLIKSLYSVRSIINVFKPDAAVGVGGYSSFPVLRYAQARRIPTFIHESNSFAGKSNILLGKKATKVFVASTGMEKFFPAGKIIVTGNPVRKAIASMNVTRESGLEAFGLQTGRKTILVTGGSLGARSINEAVFASIHLLEAEGIQLIWQTGKLFREQAASVVAGRPGMWTNDFITNMENAYAAADLVISRSGAMAVSELAVVGKPALFVPYPHAAEDHQTSNALALVQKNAARMLPDHEASSRLIPTAISMLADDNALMLLADNIRKTGVTDADVQIADHILKELKPKSISS